MEPEDREFMRELLLRHEKATDAMIARLDRGTEEIRVRTEAIRRSVDAQAESMRAHTREFVAEMQAQRRVLFLMLDHLDGRSA